MDYQLSAEQMKLQQDMAAFCREEIAPGAGVIETCDAEDKDARMRRNLERLGKAGWLAIGHSRDGLDLVDIFLTGEEIAKACGATFVSARASAFLCAGALRLFGTPGQKERYLPKLMDGSTIGSFAYSEDQAGSDLGAITAAAKEEDGSWLIGGTKDIVVNAPIADLFIVLAWNDPSAGPDAGLSLFIVEKEAQGLSTGHRVETMGLKGVPIASISLNGCRSSGILGDIPGMGLDQVRRLMSMGSIGIAALSVGIGTACMEISTAHAKGRKAFGRRIGMFQDVGFKLADMFAYNDLGRMMALRAAWAFNTGDREAEVLAACAKLFASEAATRIVNWGMQIFAGHGYIAGSDMERLYRAAKFGEICEGTSEMLRQSISRQELDRFAAV
ncbi:MAG TPA: acyl-CoA dehydrogenase family protein [Deltaproteobacteria bacterium]|nr:acyl-CoA dehydrogenase family protein [Deltaproteobacteria bacterium]